MNNEVINEKLIIDPIETIITTTNTIAPIIINLFNLGDIPSSFLSTFVFSVYSSSDVLLIFYHNTPHK